MTARGYGHGALGLAMAGIALSASVTTASAEDLSRYRTYVLGSPLAEVAAAAGARQSDIKISHERPVLVQQLEWRAPYQSASATEVDPVEAITFRFVAGQLYQLNVSYSRALTRGLTTGDLVSALTTTYGVPARGTGKRTQEATSAVPDSTVLARWNDAQGDITLMRGPFDDIQLIVRSRELGAQAAAGIQAAIVLDAAEEPLRRQQATDAQTANDLDERTRNKAGFKP